MSNSSPLEQLLASPDRLRALADDLDATGNHAMAEAAREAAQSLSSVPSEAARLGGARSAETARFAPED